MNRAGGALGICLMLAAVFLTLAVAACAGGVDPGDAPRAVYRRVQRAYDGAPPVTPHPVRALQRQDCLTCHKDGMEVPGEGLAPSTPHPEQVQCMQCHVEQVTQSAGLAENRFEGYREPLRGTRAYAGAPPTIPHQVTSRRNCLGCHDRMGGSPIRTPHADRVNCLQCHVPGSGRTPWRENTFSGEAAR